VEDAFYRKYHVPRRLALAYKTLISGCGAELFGPFYKVALHHKQLHQVSFDVSVMDLNKFKKEDKEGVGPKETMSVPYLCVQNLPQTVLSTLIE